MWLTILCYFIISALLMEIVPSPVYYFGKGNQYMCHCKTGSCDTNGYCYQSAGRCSTGWFGAACQFRSLSSNNHGQLGLLADNDDSTCLEVKVPFIIQLKSGSFFTKLVMIFNHSVDIATGIGTDLAIGLDFTVNSLKVPCQGRVDVKSNRTLFIFCNDGPFYVDQVIISLKLKQTVCSVYVNGERNFAIHQQTSSPGIKDNSTLLPVDGRKGPFDGCFEGHLNVSSQTWTLILTWPRYIHEIIIYRKPKSKGYAHMNGFYVKGYDENDVMQFQYDDKGQHVNESTVWIHTLLGEALKRIVIGINNVHVRRHLELCEVETFGDCADNYDKYCDAFCHRYTCQSGTCRNGRCMNCSNGVDYNGNCIPDRISYEEENETSWAVWLMVITIIILTVMVCFLYLFDVKTKKKMDD